LLEVVPVPVVLVAVVVVGVVVEVVEVVGVVVLVVVGVEVDVVLLDVVVVEVVGVLVLVVWWHCWEASAATVEPPWLRLPLSVVLIVLGRLVTALLNACEAFTAAAQLPEPTAAPT
jgi:hypothetical protein